MPAGAVIWPHLDPLDNCLEYDMQPISRRDVLHTALASWTTWLTGCGGGDGNEIADAAGADSAGSLASPGGRESAALAAGLYGAAPGKYRFAQKYLLQSVPSRYIASRLPGGSDYLWDRYGPTYKYVDYQTGWSWSRPGADWLDAKRVRYGTAPWFSVPADKASGSSAVAAYQANVTSVLQVVQAESRWCAFLLVAKNAPRTIAGTRNGTQPAPYVDVTYQDGRTARLACRVVAANSSSSTGPSSATATCPLPAFVEFERPADAVASARLNFVVTEHWSGANPAIEGYLLDPPINTDPVVLGVAQYAGKLDEGIEAKTPIIGAHRYVDGSKLSDFVHDGETNYGAERNFDPAIFQTGATDLSKFPHAGLGKWVNAGPNWSLVPSTYVGEGFKPLATGLGALRIPMPAQPGVHDGSVVGYSGTLAGNGMIFLPEPLFGKLGRIFVRYYFRLGSPYKATVDRRFHVYQDPGVSEWTTYAGKFGIGPDHSTSYGGVSGSSGGGYGWQMRSSWYECDAGVNGPDEGGWAPGFHLYDFQYQNPPGYNCGTEGAINEVWGQRGGLGGMLYADQWYCIETEIKLNTVMQDAPGFAPDGELRAWIDGRLVYERTGMVFRTLPLAKLAYNPDKLRPCRNLGVRGLWLNWFHGGKTVSTFDRTTFYTGLVWSKKYIGPMKL